MNKELESALREYIYFLEEANKKQLQLLKANAINYGKKELRQEELINRIKELETPKMRYFFYSASVKGRFVNGRCKGVKYPNVLSLADDIPNTLGVNRSDVVILTISELTEEDYDSCNAN